MINVERLLILAPAVGFATLVGLQGPRRGDELTRNRHSSRYVDTWYRP